MSQLLRAQNLDKHIIQGTGLVTVHQAIEMNPQFLDDQNEHQLVTGRIFHADGTHTDLKPDDDFLIGNDYWVFGSAVALNSKGEPDFARGFKRERTNNINALVLLDEHGYPYIGCHTQGRQHVQDPRDPERKQTLMLGETTMGFAAFGDEVRMFNESALETAEREALEEYGIRGIHRMERPNFPWQFPLPSAVSSNNRVVFIFVNAESIHELTPDKAEWIQSNRFKSVPRFYADIAAGVTEEDGEETIWRGGNSNGVWLMFMAAHPEIQAYRFRDTEHDYPEIYQFS